MVITIDGPAASGKTTISKQLGKILRIPVIHSGELWRSIGRWSIRMGIETPEVLAIYARTMLIPPYQGGLYDEDILDRTLAICDSPMIRETVNNRIRDRARMFGDCIVEGREQGLTVFPRSRIRILLDREMGDRAIDRADRLKVANVDEVMVCLKDRDRRDRERDYGPLCPRDSRTPLDTTGMTPEQTVLAILAMITQSENK